MNIRPLSLMGIGFVSTALLSGFSVFGDDFLTTPNAGLFPAMIRAGGVVRLVFDGVVHLDETLLINTNTTVDATGYSVTLDGGASVRHFVVTNGATLRLVNLTLARGSHIGAPGLTNETGHSGLGGAILSSGSAVELVNCRFVSNEVVGGRGGPSLGWGPDIPTFGGAGLGGAVCSRDGRLAITNCTFANNACTGGAGVSGSLSFYSGGGGDALGGAVYTSNSAVILVGVTFTNNTAKAGEMSLGRPYYGGGRANGGALAGESATMLGRGCAFNANQALGTTGIRREPVDSGNAYGGALFYRNGSVRIEESTFARNLATGGDRVGGGANTWISADGLGGAIYAPSSQVLIRNSAIIDNEARGGPVSTSLVPAVGGHAVGGGICGTDLSIINCTLAGNSAIGGSGLPANSGGSAEGGAVAWTATLVNVTLANNTVTAGETHPGADWVPPPQAQGSSLSGSFVLTNTILLCRPSETNLSGTVSDGGHNLSSDASPKFSLPTSRTGIDPLLAPLADNGGSTPTMALLPLSPAMDSGDDSAAPPTDQRGVSRPKGAASDIGAFELAPKLAVTPIDAGKLRVVYSFRANETNQVSASSDLSGWLPIGTRVSDNQGAFEVEEVNSAIPERFYRMEAIK
jgi:hypothetical protein